MNTVGSAPALRSTEKRAMKTYLDPEEVNMMERAANCLRDRLLIRLLFRLGCRVSEALALRVDDIDFAHSTVTIEHLKSRTRLTCPRCKARLGKKHRFCPECGQEVSEVTMRQKQHRRIRVLPVDGDTLAMLKGFVRCRDRNDLIFGISRHRAWQIVRDCARRAGFPDLVNPDTGKVRGVSPHRLRDAFAVHAVKLDDSGDGLRLLQEHLGHSSFDTTAKYRKVAGEEHRRWYERLWGNEISDEENSYNDR